MTLMTQETESPHMRVCARAFLYMEPRIMRARISFLGTSVISVIRSISLAKSHFLASFERHLASLTAFHAGVSVKELD